MTPIVILRLQVTGNTPFDIVSQTDQVGTFPIIQVYGQLRLCRYERALCPNAKYRWMIICCILRVTFAVLIDIALYMSERTPGRTWRFDDGKFQNEVMRSNGKYRLISVSGVVG
jgi:hypothetical protein